jgi:hypothetical protein
LLRNSELLKGFSDYYLTAYESVLDFIERMDMTRLKISTQDYDDLFGSGDRSNGLLSGQPRLANEDRLAKENQTIKESFYGGNLRTTSPNMN